MSTNERSELEDEAGKMPSARVGVEDYTDSLASLLEAQRQAMEEVRESDEIPDDEKATRLLGIQESIQAIVNRIEEEETKNAGFSVRRGELEQARKAGLRMIASIRAGNGNGATH